MENQSQADANCQPNALSDTERKAEALAVFHFNCAC